MAKKVAVELIDDLSGEPGATTTRFALDGMGMRGWQAWLPFGPAELAAVRATAL